MRIIRRLTPDAVEKVKAPLWFKAIPFWGVFGALLSIVPGLAHFLQRRFREVLPLVLVWVVLFAAGLLFLGGNIGMLLMGLALATHTWIAYKSGLTHEVKTFGQKCVCMIVIIFILSIVYYAGISTAFHDLMIAYCNISVPSKEIQAGDRVLARRSLLETEPIERGTLVTLNLGRTAIYQRETQVAPALRNNIMGQVVAVGGDKLEIHDGQYFVDGEPLDVEEYPVPIWLLNIKLSATIPDGRYFVASEYSVYAREGGLTPDRVLQRCVMASSNFEGIVYRRWLPITRRGLITETE